MNSIRKLVFCIITSTVIAATAARSAEHVIIVPARGLPADSTRAVLAEVLRLVLERWEPGTRVTAVDPIARTVWADFAVPAGTPRQRAMDKELRSQILGLRQAFESNPARTPWETATLRIPETLRFLRTQVVRNGEEVRVVFVGSPINRSADGMFDMKGGAVPGDGWLNAGAQESPFSVGPDASAVKGWVVHIAVLPAEWGKSDWQRAEVVRFWAAFIGSQSGALATVADPKLALQRLTDGVKNPIPFRPLDREDLRLVWRKRVFERGAEVETTVKSTDMVETTQRPGPNLPSPARPTMIPPVPIPAPVLSMPTRTNPIVAAPVTPAAPPPAPPAVAPALPRVEETRPAPEPVPKPIAPVPVATPIPAELPVPAPGNIGVAAVWDGGRGADVDLYVSANTQARLPEAYWHRPRVERVHLFRDIRTSQSVRENARWQAVWEYAEIQGARMDEPSVWLNLYEANGPVSGIVRLQFEGRVVDRPFKFNVQRGNHGRDSDLAARAHSPYWQKVDLGDFDVPGPVAPGKAAASR